MDFFFLNGMRIFFFKSKLDDGKYIYVGKILHSIYTCLKLKAAGHSFFYVYTGLFDDIALVYVCESSECFKMRSKRALEHRFSDFLLKMRKKGLFIYFYFIEP